MTYHGFFIFLYIFHIFSIGMSIFGGPEILSYAHPLVNCLSELWAQSTITI